MRIYTRREVLAEGHTDFDIARMTAPGGPLQRIAPGIYVREPVDDAEEFHRELARWVPQLPGEAWAQGTAALLHGLPVRHVPRRLVAVGEGSGSSLTRALVHHTTARLTEEDVVRMAGLAVTSLARTVVDVARTSPFPDGVVAADAARRIALQQGRDLEEELQAALDRVARMRGCARARSVVATSCLGAESPMETRSRIALRAMGLPAPVLQYEVFDESGTFLGRVDMAWPELGVLGEYDGEGKYRELRGARSIDEVVLTERARQLRMEDAGWVVVRWGRDELRDRERLRTKIVAAFDRARRLRAA